MAQERGGFVPLTATSVSELEDLQKVIKDRRNASRLTMGTTALGAAGCAVVAFIVDGAAAQAADVGLVTSVLATGYYHHQSCMDNAGLKALQRELSRRRAKP